MTSFHALAQVASETLLNGVVWGLGLTVFAGIVLRLLSRENSGTRFVIWYSVLLAIVIFPVLDTAIPVRNKVGVAAEITIPTSWASYFFAAWALVASISLFRMVAGLWQVRKLRRSAPANDATSALLRSTARDFPVGRPVEIGISDKVSVPTALGFFRPIILVPRWAGELPEAELRAVLLHEMAHLRRRDDWTNLLQRFLGALLFFHPAVWWIQRRLSLEREMACDDLVLGTTKDPKTYAQCLVAMAERSLVRRGLALAQAAVGRLRQTSQRVAQILNPRRSSASGVWKPSFAILAVGAIGILATAPHIPRLVAFGNDSPQVAPSFTTASADPGSASVGARVFPASAKQEKTAVRRLAALSRPQHRAPVVTLTKAKSAPQKHRPLVVQADWRQPPATCQPEDVKAPDVFLVVMQNQQFGPSGTSFWSISIYRLTVFHPSQQQIRNETPAKSI